MQESICDIVKKFCLKMIKFIKKIYYKFSVLHKVAKKHVVSLAPMCHDSFYDNEYKIYSDYLVNAFNNINIRNIAITGNYGVGKSSFLKKWSANKKYLFISLCDFSENKSRNLECDLLQQLLLGCGYVTKRNNNQIVQPKWSKFKTFLIVVCGAVISLTTYLLTFANVFETALKEFEKSLSMIHIDMIKCIAYGAFSIVMILGITFLIMFLIKNYSPSKISLKLDKVEIEADSENDSSLSYMDRHRLDLVCALRAAAKKIDYTVIFEDMDRLGDKNCQALFTELRELNRLVNNRNFGKTAKKTVRFVYVIHDAIFSNNNSNAKQDNLHHLKFFDYVIPILPSLVAESSIGYVTECFERVGFANHQFINEISKYLFDYRAIKNITNEYAVTEDIFLLRNGNTTQFDDQEKCELMALIIYKVLMPDDYKKIRDNESVVFSSQKNKTQTISDVVQCLVDNEWLSYKCFKFMGYAHSEIEKYIEKFFDSTAEVNDMDDKIRRQMICENFESCIAIIKNKISENENNCKFLNNVCYTLLENALKSNKVSYLGELLPLMKEKDWTCHEVYLKEHTEALTEYMSASFGNPNAVDDLVSIIEYLTMLNHENFDWFFIINNNGSDEKLNDIRWEVICRFENETLSKFILRSEERLTEWINSVLSGTQARTEYLDSHCSKELAKKLSDLKIKEEIKNYFNMMLSN